MEPQPNRGKVKPSKVSRSRFQQEVEKNKRLEADIYLLVMESFSAAGLGAFRRWKEKFDKDEELRQLLHDHSVQWIKDHPDSIATQLAREFPPKQS